ncbi:MAG: AAA family ATPase [Flavobacteriales bacterium]|nr:AAA family ATPase [Flavobacteriales bacterium]
MERKDDVQLLDSFVSSYNGFKNEISKIIVGQDNVVRDVLITIFCNGHCLLIGVPGLAKTLLVQTIAKALGLSFSRIQFTPDLMPSDIVGSEILNAQRSFEFIKGPIFSNIILADEINRTPPKTQSALLEAMQEKSITNSGNTYKLDVPFFVLATQNPIEQEGTYPLPEAQLDRFMFSVVLKYPSFQEEIEIIKSSNTISNVNINPVLTVDEIIKYQDLIQRMPVTDNVLEYIVNLVTKTRPIKHNSENNNKYIEWGAGPRASQYLLIASKCNAAIKGKYSPDIEDVREVAVSVLRHRVLKNYKAEAENLSVEQIINNLF